MPKSASHCRKITSLVIVIALSKLAGLVRETLVAAHFGVGDDVALLEASLRLVSLVCDTFLCGAFAGIITPECTAKDRHTAGALGGRLCAAALLISLAVTVGIGALSGSAARAIAPELDEGNMQKMILTLLPLIPLNALSFALIGYLHAREKFLLGGGISLIGGAFTSLYLIFAKGEADIFTLARTLSVGTALQCALLTLGACREGLRLAARRVRVPWRRLIRLYPAHTVSLALIPAVNLIAVRAEGEGMASFSYALKIFLLAGGILTFATSQVIYPVLARYRTHEAQAYASKAALPLVAILTGMASVLAAYSEGIVSALFSRGSFREGDVARAGASLALLAIALPLSGMTDILQRYLLAQKKTLAAAVGVAAGMGGAVLAARYGGAVVIIAAYAAASLSMYLSGAEIPRKSSLFHLAYFAAAGVAVYVFSSPLAAAFEDSLLLTAAGAALSGAVYFAFTLPPILFSEKGRKKYDKGHPLPQ